MWRDVTEIELRTQQNDVMLMPRNAFLRIPFWNIGLLHLWCSRKRWSNYLRSKRKRDSSPGYTSRIYHLLILAMRHVIGKKATWSQNYANIVRYPLDGQHRQRESTFVDNPMPKFLETKAHPPWKSYVWLNCHRSTRGSSIVIYRLFTIVGMSLKSNRRREKKRSLIRRQLYQHRRECAELIRAIRYMRLRNEEVAMLQFLRRLQSCIHLASLNQVSLPPRQTFQVLVNHEKTRDWKSPKSVF